MRNDNLKNELDNIPQDFDRDQLWSTIEKPKKKKDRKAIWFFIFGISLVGLLLFTLKNNNLNPQDEIVHDNTNIQAKPLQEPLLKAIDKSNNPDLIDVDNQTELQKSNADNSKLSFQLTSESNQKKPSIIKQSTGSFLENKTMNFGESKVEIFSEGRGKSEQGTAEIEASKKVDEIDIVEYERHQFYKLNAEISGRLPTNINNQKTNSIYPTQRLQKHSNVSILPTKQFLVVQQDLNKLRLDKKVSVLEKYGKNQVSYHLTLIGLFGNVNHVFEEKTPLLNRNQNEKSLESIGLSLLGHVNIRRIRLFSGFSYVRYNTHLNFTTEENTILNSVEGPAHKNFITSYSLYNAYQYIDLVGGVGYEIPLTEKWSIVPSIQIGYTLGSDIKGEIFSGDDYLQYNSSLDGYSDYSKWQGQANLNVERKLNNKWNIGVMAYVNSQKSLTSSESHTHKVSSFGVGFSFVRKLN